MRSNREIVPSGALQGQPRVAKQLDVRVPFKLNRPNGLFERWSTAWLKQMRAQQMAWLTRTMSLSDRLLPDNHEDIPAYEAARPGVSAALSTWLTASMYVPPSTDQ